MAQKIIGIKLEVDAEQGKKLSLVLQQTEKSAEGLTNRTKELQRIEDERSAVLDKQRQAYTRLTGVIDSANQAIANNARGSNLGIYSANAALQGYQNTLTQTTAKLEELNKKQQELLLTKRSFISGRSEADLQAEERKLSVQKQQEEIARILTTAYKEQVAQINKAEQAEAKRLATLKSAAYYGMQEQTGYTPAKAPAQNFNYATGAYRDTNAEFKKYMLEQETLAHAEHQKYLQRLSDKKFADQAYINSKKVMYAKMFDEIAAREEAATRRAKPVDARTIAPVVQNPYTTYNVATGAKSFKPDTSYDVQAEAAKIKAIVDHENAIRDASRNKNLIAQLKHAKDLLDIEQKLVRDIEVIRQRVSSGFITKSQGIEEQRRALGAYGDAIRNLPSLNQHIAEHKNLFIHVGEIIGAYRVLNLVINTVSNAIQSIPKIGIELESTIASLTATMGAFETGGSSAGMVASMRALNEEASRTGINIATLRENFRGFQASTSLAGESLNATWNIFTNLNTTITGLHLSADKAKGIFNALAQIFNKNKVQSEELVKQLGNLLPGAFASFAKANEHLFGSSQDLIAQMRKGTVFAHETVENFANFLAQRFAPAFALAQQGLNANIGRMQTSFIALGEAIYEVSSGPMLTFVKGVTSINESLIEAIKGTTEFGKSLNEAFNTGVNITLSLTAGYLTTIALRSRAALAVFTGAKAAAVSIGEIGIAASLVAGRVKLLEAALSFLKSPALLGVSAIVAGLTSIGLKAKEAADRVQESRDRINDTLQAVYTKINVETIKPIELQIDEDANVKKVVASIKDAKAEITRLQKLDAEGTRVTDVDGQRRRVIELIQEQQVALDRLQTKYKDVRLEAERSIKINVDSSEALDRLDKIRERAKELHLEASGDKVGLAEFRFDKANLDSLKALQVEVDNSKTKIEEWQKIVNKGLVASGVDENELNKWDEATRGLDLYKKNLEAVKQLEEARANTIRNAEDKQTSQIESEFTKEDRLFKQQQDQATKVLESKKQTIAEIAEREKLGLEAQMEAVRHRYAMEEISIYEFTAKKAELERQAKDIAITAIQDEIEAVKEKLAVYKEIPAEVANAKKILKEFASEQSSPDIDISITAENFEYLQKLVKDYDNSLKGTNTRLDEIRKTEVEINQLETRKINIQNNYSAQVNENLRTIHKAHTDLQNSIAITTQAYLEQLGVIDEIAIREAITARYAGEIKQLSNITPDSPDYGAAQQRLKIIEAQKEIEIQDKVVSMHREQEDAIRDVTKAYQNMGLTASDALNLQLQGFGQLVTIFDEYGRRQQQFQDRQIEFTRGQEDIGRKISDIMASVGPEGATEAQIEALNNYNDQYMALAKERKKAQIEETADKIGDFRKVAGVSKTFFAENTKARQTLHNVEMTLGAVETATKLASLAIDGAKAILTQGQGDPYTAFARIAAMTALVAGIIAGVGGAATKSGTSNSSTPLSKGTGTTLGEPDKVSTDLQDTLELLADVNYRSYRELRKLNEKFGSVSNGIYRLALLSANERLLNASTIKEGTFSNVPKISTKDTMKAGAMNLAFPPDWQFILAGIMKIQEKDPISQFILKGIFGKTTIKIIDSGIQIAETTIAALARGEELLIQQYATIERSKKSWFGKSKKIFDSFQDANALAKETFTTIYDGMYESILGLARLVSVSSIKAAYGYTFPELKISFKDKNAEEIQKTIQGVISTQLNLFSEAVFGIFNDLRQLGEGMFQTVSRIIIQRTLVKDALDKLDIEIPKNNVQAIYFTNALVELSSTTGTATEKLKKFINAENEFYKNFVSKEQQRLDTVEAVGRALAGVFENAKSKAQRDKSLQLKSQEALVAELTDTLTTTLKRNVGIVANQEILQAQDALAKEQSKLARIKDNPAASLQDIFLDAFKASGDFGDALVKVKQELALNGKVGKSTYTQISALNDLYKEYQSILEDIQKPIKDQITALQDSIDTRTKEQLLIALGASKDINEQKALADKVRKLLLDKYNAEMNAIKTITNAYKQLGDIVKNLLLGDLSVLGPKAKLDEARKQYEDTLAATRDPDKVKAAEAATKLGSIAQAYLQQAKTYYSSTTAYNDIFRSVTDTLQGLANTTVDTTQSSTDIITEEIKASTNATIEQLKALQTVLAAALSETLKVTIVDEKIKTDKESVLSDLFTKFAEASPEDRPKIEKQIEAYRTGFKKDSYAGGEEALALQQERQYLKDSIADKQKRKTKAKENGNFEKAEDLQDDILTMKARLEAVKAKLATIGFKASGGNASGPTVVGERGIEFVNLPAGSNVSSNSQTNSIIALANRQVIAELRSMNKELRSLNERMFDIERKTRLSKNERAFI